TGWKVQVQDPMNSKKRAIEVLLKNRALSVSGSYEKFFEGGGKRYAHIMDPRTGMPVEGVLSVAVISQGGPTGASRGNLFYVQGLEWSRKRLSQFSANEVFFFLSGGHQPWRMVRLRRGAISRPSGQRPHKHPFD